MRKTVTTLLAASLLTAPLPLSVRAGAWLQPAGGSYAKLYGSYLYSTREFNADGHRVDILAGQNDVSDTAFRDVTVAGYVEYGVRDNLTLIAKLPFRILTARRTEITDLADLRYNVEAVNGGLSDLEVGGRVPLLTAPLPISVQVGVKLPLGYPSRPTNGGAALGSGSADLEGRILAGLSLHPYGYVGLEAGYRFRGGDVDDQVDVMAEAGTKWRRVRVGAKLNASFSTGSIEPLTESSTKHVTNYESVQLIPSVAMSVAPGVAVVGEALHTLDGRNTIEGTVWAIGIELVR